MKNKYETVNLDLSLRELLEQDRHNMVYVTEPEIDASKYVSSLKACDNVMEAYKKK